MLDNIKYIKKQAKVNQVIVSKIIFLGKFYSKGVFQAASVALCNKNLNNAIP